jgi:hypothetical protein
MEQSGCNQGVSAIVSLADKKHCAFPIATGLANFFRSLGDSSAGVAHQGFQATIAFGGHLAVELTQRGWRE